MKQLKLGQMHDDLSRDKQLNSKLHCCEKWMREKKVEQVNLQEFLSHTYFIFCPHFFRLFVMVSANFGMSNKCAGILVASMAII